MPEDNEVYVQVKLADYRRLMDAEEKLRKLEAGGVDNWEWYGDAMSAPSSDVSESGDVA